MATYSSVPTSTVTSSGPTTYTVASGTYVIVRMQCGSATGSGILQVNGSTILVSTFVGSVPVLATQSATLVAGDVLSGSGDARYHVEVYPL